MHDHRCQQIAGYYGIAARLRCVQAPKLDGDVGALKTSSSLCFAIFYIFVQTRFDGCALM